MNISNDISDQKKTFQLPSAFVINISADGTMVVSHKIIMKALVVELLITVGGTVGGCLLLHKDLQFAMYLFAFAALGLTGMWISVQKLSIFTLESHRFHA